MTTVIERPLPDSGRAEDYEEQYLFWRHHDILGWSNADCWVCAWKDGYGRFGICGMATVITDAEPSDRFQPCKSEGPHRTRLGTYLSFEGQKVLGFATEGCQPCAWRALYDRYPLGRLAIVIDCGPPDLMKKCRGRNQRK